MTVSTMKASFPCDVKKVWDTVTSLENYQWRSDLSKLEVQNETQFVEYTKDGFSTVFTITACEPYRRWEFVMENANLTGRWQGVFSEKDGRTELDFTEEVTAKRLLMRPFVKVFLQKQQRQYLADLKRALESPIL